MILSVCPNPSIDCTIELDNLSVGKLNRIDNKVETYSGKALNVAIGIARLNEKCLATGFMFDNHKHTFETNLKNEGVDFDFVCQPGSARVNYKIIDKKAMLTEINDRGENVSLEKQAELIALIKKYAKDSQTVVISGSLPKGVEPEFYGEMVKAAKSNAKIIIDTERKNMLSALSSGSIFMVKPNLTELEAFSGMTIRSYQDAIKASYKYLDKGAENVLVSMGADGALFTNGQESYYCKSENVAVNSTVGAGDSMISAVCVALKRKVDNPELIKMAVAAGTAAVTTSGTNLFYYDKYKEIYDKISTTKL